MTLTRKFTTALILSIILIAIINIIAFSVFYTSYLSIYIAEKDQVKKEITLDYIGEIVEKQTEEEIDNLFADTEIEFFELLDRNNEKIPLNTKENVNIVVNYLIKKGISPKYINEIIPEDNFGKVLELIKDENSPEYGFISKLTTSVIITNIISILIIIFVVSVFTRILVKPIKEVTKKIKNLKGSVTNTKIKYYNKKDEVGLLITAINGLNERLTLEEDIRNRMLADISHELKTPITSIQCYLEGISDGVIKLNDKNLKSITSEMERLINLVNKIMEHEKFSREKLKLDKKEDYPSEIIKNMVETHKKKLKENKQRIKVVGDDDLIIELDKNLFKQIVHNLIGNFLKYSGKKTTLTINITKKYIQFNDNGKGIRSSEVAFLTQKFYQGNLDKSGSIDSRGIGVGLSLVQKIVLSHKWRSEIKSDIGKGFSFRIYI